MATDSSKCADRAAVHGHRRPAVLEHPHLGAARRSPWARWPGTSRHQALAPARGSVVRDLRLLVKARPDAVAHELAHHRVAAALGQALHGVADVAHALAGLADLDPREERGLRWSP